MEETNPQHESEDQRALTEDVRVESKRENDFVNGYMALMHCTERAARSVYMHLALASQLPIWTQ